MYFISIGIDVFSTAILFIPVILLLYHFRKPYSLQKTLLITLFSIYLSAVFSVTGIPSIDSLVFDLHFNFTPFVCFFEGYSSGLKNLLLNILLFVPFGVLLPFFDGKYNSLKAASVMGLGFSLFIEILQIFTFRATDIDDLIANTLGSVIGFCLIKLVLLIMKKINLSFLQKKEIAVCNSSNSSPQDFFLQKYAPFFTILVTFFIMFFVQCFISGKIWEIIL